VRPLLKLNTWYFVSGKYLYFYGERRYYEGECYAYIIHVSSDGKVSIGDEYACETEYWPDAIPREPTQYSHPIIQVVFE